MSQPSRETLASAPPQPAARATLIPAWAMVVIAIVSVQYGGAVAKQLFDTAGTSGVVFLRTAIAGLVFVALWRPQLRVFVRREGLWVVLYGVNIAAMMLTYYASISRIPLGVAVAIAFAGPLGLAAITSRRIIHFVWVALAAVGVLLLSPLADMSLDALGVGFALLSALGWATYILVSRKVTKLFDGNSALAVSMCIAALVALPLGIQGASRVLVNPSLIMLSVVVALLSSAIPFALEFSALKILSARVFGLLVSLEPVVATIIGFLVLQEVLGGRELLGIALVTIAAVATARSEG